MPDSLKDIMMKNAMGQGNMNLFTRPIVKNPDGSISTVRSMSFGNDEGEVLIPTVEQHGKGILSDDDAINQYYSTGEYLGKFKTPEEATEYGKNLHEDMAGGIYSVPLASSHKGVDPIQLEHVLYQLLMRPQK